VGEQALKFFGELYAVEPEGGDHAQLLMP